MKTRSPIPSLLGVAALGIASAFPLAAQDSWRTGANGSFWLTPGDWSAGVPGATQTAGWNGNSGGAGVGGGSVVVNANAEIGRIAFSGSTSKNVTIHSGISLSFFGTGADRRLIDHNGATSFSVNGTGDLDLRSSGVFHVANDGRSLTITSRVVETGGSREITKTGAGILTMNNLITADSTFSGGIHVQAGGLASNVSSSGIGNAVTRGPFGTGALTFESGTFLRYTHTTNAGTFHNRLQVNGDITLGSANPQRMVLAGDADFGSATRTLSVLQEVEISGTILNGGLTKGGASTLILSGNNSYTGATTVNAGRLVLDSSGALSSSSSIYLAAGAVLEVQNSYALSSGQTLTGAGTVEGTYRSGSGVTRAAGGDLVIDADAVFDGGSLGFSFTSGGTDEILLSGADHLIRGNVTGSVGVTLDDADGMITAGRYLLVSTVGLTNATYNDWGLSTFSLTQGFAGWSSVLVWDNGSLYADVAAIPEGRTWVMLMFGAAALFLVRRKQSHA